MGVDPFTAALVIGAASSIGGSVLGAKGSVEDAEAEAKATEYNSALQLRESRIEEARRRRIARRELSSQRVAFAKSGVLLEGSPLELLADNAAEFERDSIEVGISARSTAELDRKRAKNIQKQGRRAATAQLIGGVTQLAGTAARFG